MFDIGFSELLLLGAIALIVIGPKQLPEVARAIARLLNELKRATGDIGNVVMDIKNQSDDVFKNTQSSLTKVLLEAGKDLKEPASSSTKSDPDPKPPEEPKKPI